MYILPADEMVITEFERKKSRFITYLTRVSSEAEARAFIDEVKHTYPDARHHCSAYRYQVDGAQPVERSSDDGEPSGTAGAPMLEVLRGHELYDVATVVVRYFGGIKLGTGGLVRAYTDGVADAVNAATLKVKKRRHTATLTLNHADAGRIESELRARDIDIVDVTYASHALLTVAVDPARTDMLTSTLAALTQGQVEPEWGEPTWLELPYPG